MPRLLPTFLTLGLCLQCVTPKSRMMLSGHQDLAMECRYLSGSKRPGISEVECVLENQGDGPARIRFASLSLDDPRAEIIPVDATTLHRDQTLQNIGVILGAIVILGALVALATKSKIRHIPALHLSMPGPGSAPPGPAVTIEAEDRRIDAVEIAAHRSAILAFKTKHGVSRPAVLAVQLDDGEPGSVRVPINEPFGSARGRSNFDY